MTAISTEVLVDEELEKRLLPHTKTILYVGIKYDYGHPEWGLSYEHYNFYKTMEAVGYSLIYFDYMVLSQKYGTATMSNLLREAVYYYNPDILFYFNFHDWVSYDVWKEISNELPTKTIIWLGDDSWRYEETRPIWELFNIVITIDKDKHNKRKEEGFNSVLSQWACNHWLYRKLNLSKVYDISFVGRCYGERKEFIELLREYGIDIATFGQGWEGGGRVSQADLIRIYNQSKIVLNISKTSKGDKIQIKGRDFEVPGCGSLSLTQESEEIKEYFEPDNEIVTYKDVDEAIQKIKYYLSHEKELDLISNNGYQRVLKDHTYKKRLKEVIDAGME